MKNTGIYQEIILDHASNPRNIGSISNPSKTTLVHNPLCGDKIKMDVLFNGEKIKDIKFQVSGCAISKATVSMLSEKIKGKTKSELRKLAKQDIIKMLGIDLGPNRLKCALISLEALHNLLV
ncbi:SUF system NifU family Fe-S cluster assembly protein [Candidatus Roizmanbacteria bacterium CG_4_10_14_0_8_um_filter_39_9]|uniref:SUF system NifU family Fe-S cluster assembly protein n=1 Tax=Candidatus Roizmanbacteria bacterium CG_4_10_14_0_8_um_filter_39_9 TaxID=1974829 RepID=A0A2M7QD61_9BACT|nr:MAG: SUF system NifU family Fe-S cluster assembly protein [Candidatus Roizmanbacteria bacterium CG_4_10_14_0_8_um_filter_39_9]